MSPHLLPTWIVHVKTQARNSHLKAYLVRAENPAAALRRVRAQCTLTAVSGVDVEMAGRLANESVLSEQDLHGLQDGGIIRWHAAVARS